MQSRRTYNGKTFQRIVVALLVAVMLCFTPAVIAQNMPEVNYTGEQTQFVFSPETTDLFVDFKNVMPGDYIEQSIRIVNSSRTSVRMYLRAEAVSAENAEFLSFFTLTVNNGSTELFNAPANEQDGLKENVLLGEMAADSELMLDLSLTASLMLGNEFQNYTGTIVWVFTIEEVETEPTPPTPPGPPITGKGSVVFFGVLAVAAGSHIFLISHKRKNKASFDANCSV